jgi:hypothetical protein
MHMSRVPSPGRCARLLLSATLVWGVAAGPGTPGSHAAAEDAVRVSDHANHTIVLTSSEEDTDFSINGTHVGRGRTLLVMIDKKQQYEVRAEPVGCQARSDTIGPPYRKRQEVAFQFMIKDCAPRVSLFEPVSDAVVGSPLIDVVFTVQSRARLADLGLWLNGAKLEAQSASLVQMLARGSAAETPAPPPTFRAQIKLRAGPNTIRVEATDRNSVTGAATTIVDYDPSRGR